MQNESILCEGVKCENAVNLSMNYNSIDLNSYKISDKMLSNHNTINTLNTYHYFHCFWPKCHFKTKSEQSFNNHKLKQYKCDLIDCTQTFNNTVYLNVHKNKCHLN